MTDAIMQQVSEQVKKVVEAASLARPLPHFKYVPSVSCEPSYRHDPMISHRRSERMREAPHANGDRRTQGEIQDCSIRVNAQYSHRPSHRGSARSTTASIPYASPTSSLVRGVRVDLEASRDHHVLKTPPPMISAPKSHNARKCCEFHEENGHTTFECWELRKALHELEDKA
ncbi:hypothetical protein Cgig2_026607 [Carnegiea gigantea]|uniref:Uncharacterized protein n=1 Tax=Carnegiea gigantea TaxID=171969 RepID=A0A9Q1QJ01_9CARY|nr:hypothetical protein Cgig2_026607 [Carnegiea gigantea]